MKVVQRNNKKKRERERKPGKGLWSREGSGLISPWPAVCSALLMSTLKLNK
jgi:hypothetical protein